MKKEDLENVKKKIEEYEKEINEMKEANPLEDFSEIEGQIEELKQMISYDNISKFKRKIILSRILKFFLSFIFHLIVTFSVFGFCIGFVNDDMVKYIGIIIPVVAVVLMIVRITIKRIFYKSNTFKKILFYPVCIYFLFVCLIGVLDYFFIGIWTSIWWSVLTLCILAFVLEIGEYIYITKLVLRYRK